MRRLARKLVSTLIYSFYWLRNRRRRGVSARILTYHRIAYDPSDRLAVSPSVFDAQMRALKRNGYRVLGLKDIYYSIINSERPLDRIVAITFDDGYLDNYTEALPILAKYGYEATVFLPTLHISDPLCEERNRMEGALSPMLNWDEVREMARKGISFGAHSHTHGNLSSMPLRQAETEIRMSKEIIENETGKTVEFFCYPDGRLNPDVMKLVEQAGYLGACSVFPGENGRSTDLYALKRTEISGEDSLFDFIKKLEGAYDPLHRWVQKRQGRTREACSSTRTVKTRDRTAVLHVIDSLVAEGAEQLLVDILSASDREKHEYIVCCLASGGPLVAEIQSMGIPVCVIGRKSKWDLKAFRRLCRLIRDYNPDIVHTHLFTSSTWGRIAAWLAGTRMVCTEHNTSDWKRWYHRLANRWLARLTHRIIAVSEHVRDSLVSADGIPEGRIRVIKNGVSLERLEPRKERFRVRREFNCGENDILAVTVAALSEQKGHRYLLEAARKYGSKRRNLHLACVGDGPLRSQLEAQAREGCAEGKITFTGVRRDIQEILNAADIFVLPSLYEGLSISLLEAAAMGKPVITTARGAAEEIFRHGESGLLVESRNADCLAEAIEYLASDREKAEELGRNASRIVRSGFTIKATAMGYEEVYAEVLKS